MTTTHQQPAAPIAIIGIGCRFPGAPSPEAFWSLLRDGTHAVREIPPDRWDAAALYAPYLMEPGKMNTRWAGLIEGIDQFDRKFFGIWPDQAAHMDVLQRLLLEVSYEALEDGGQDLNALAGTPVGVFQGVPPGDYGRMMLANPDKMGPYTSTGALLSISANRISYQFDFRGPSIALDTACSSSLVAVHLACQSLRAGECTMALAGGVNAILFPPLSVSLTKAGAMSPDGCCHAFDAAANGYVRGEGVGVVLLKPLDAALRDGDRVHAVILGTAVNQDGRTNGLTAPNRWAQEEVLRRACASAGINPADVQHVEAHGTGTLLGDPIEALALGAVLKPGRAPDAPCRISSVKTNIGHLETAAGVAGLIRVALELRERTFTPMLHFKTPNPHIDFDALGLAVQRRCEPWPAPPNGARRLAGISSFGFGGTNSHAVLSEAPPSPPVPPRPAGPYLLPLSAKSPASLRALVSAYRAACSTVRVDEPYDYCYTAARRRTHFSQRAAFVFTTQPELLQQLDAWLEGRVATSATPLAAAEAYRNNQPVDWSTCFPITVPPAPLPHYPWDHERCWWGETESATNRR